MKTLNLKHKTHFLWMAMCFLLLVFTGCSKDEDPLVDGESSEIVGKWIVEKHVYQEIPGNTDTYPAEIGESKEFKKDGTGSSNTPEGEYGTVTRAFKWKLLDSKLTIAYDNDPEEELFTIVKLTDKELVYKVEGTGKNAEGQHIKWVETIYNKK